MLKLPTVCSCNVEINQPVDQHLYFPSQISGCACACIFQLQLSHGAESFWMGCGDFDRHTVVYSGNILLCHSGGSGLIPIVTITSLVALFSPSSLISKEHTWLKAKEVSTTLIICGCLKWDLEYRVPHPSVHEHWAVILCFFLCWAFNCLEKCCGTFSCRQWNKVLFNIIFYCALQEVAMRFSMPASWMKRQLILEDEKTFGGCWLWKVSVWLIHSIVHYLCVLNINIIVHSLSRIANFLLWHYFPCQCSFIKYGLYLYKLTLCHF